MSFARPISTGLAAAVCLAVAAPLFPAGDRGAARAEGPVRERQEATCTFFRGQAYRRGMVHFATEMLWACEAIATRRAAGMPVGVRLEATEAALQRYRSAVIDAGRTAFAETRLSDAGPQVHGLSDGTKHRIAAETGALAALEAIRNGF